MNRRDFLKAGFVAAAAGQTGCTWPAWSVIPPWLPIKVIRAGMEMGHRARDLRQLPKATTSQRVDTLIVGSGIAGLTAAWRLKQAGHTDVLMLDGPEWAGNASAGVWPQTGLVYPRGAHYLPFPTPESSHVQTLLQDLAISQPTTTDAVTGDSATRYQEQDTVFAPTERLWQNGQWHDSLIPQAPKGSVAAQQLQRFLGFVESLKGQRGTDGRVIFAIPVVMSSQDPHWQALDRLSFAAWLKQQGYDATELLWFLDYSCKDDYGAGMATVSAWAGLHYFASRVHEREQHDGAPLLTWPDGLHHLAQRLAQRSQIKRLALTALRIQSKSNTDGQGATVVAMDATGHVTQIEARRVVSAMPLHVLRHVWSGAAELGLSRTTPLLPHVPWLVCNVWIDGVLGEKHGAPLSWENIIYGSPSLGYVDATHQSLRGSAEPQTVLTCYHAITDRSPTQARAWLQTASHAELLQMGLQDLLTAYGPALWGHVAGVEICVRGHAMSSPAVGSLHDPLLQRLREVDGAVLLAHSDLSGYSVFEEASYWGWQAAERVLG